MSTMNELTKQFKKLRRTAEKLKDEIEIVLLNYKPKQFKPVERRKGEQRKGERRRVEEVVEQQDETV